MVFVYLLRFFTIMLPLSMVNKYYQNHKV